MATITINIPADKEDWVLDGFGIRFNYETDVPNPDFNDELPEDPGTNPATIPNPENTQAFTKRMIIDAIKDFAKQGHDTASFNANGADANDVILT
jgi:hypothetical protein